MLNKPTNKQYVSIINGTIRERSYEGAEGSVKRDIELKDGTKTFKWEIIYKDIEGIIEDINIKKGGEYGDNIEITIDGVTLSIGVKTNYGTDLMKKLPEIDLTQSVKLVPYSFTDDNGKLRKGITVWQNNKKIPSYFHIMDGKKMKSIHGFPVPGLTANGEKYTKNEWIAFYLRVEDFLIAYTENNIISNIKKELIIEGTQEAVENAREIIGEEPEIKDGEVPF